MSVFQDEVAEWAHECFGQEIAEDMFERNLRFIEEALELVQAYRIPKERVLKIVDYVYSRGPGDEAQEVGGVLVTLAALCAAAGGLDMPDCGWEELRRIQRPEVMERVRAKNIVKQEQGL